MNDNQPEPPMHGCMECGNKTPNRWLICDPCGPKGYNRPFGDDVDPAAREPKEG